VKKKVVAILCFGIYQMVNAENSIFNSEQIGAADFVKRMYSYDPASFEFGEFSKIGIPFKMNKVSGSSAKYTPAKRCDLLLEYFEQDLVKRRSAGEIGCDIRGDGEKHNFLRFPAAESEELSPESRDDILPPEFKSVSVTGNRAVVEVLPKGFNMPSRNLFFLVKGDQGWRVHDVLMQQMMGSVDRDGNRCWAVSLRKGEKLEGPDQMKKDPSFCR
jgi:hypothetical protein